MTKKILVGTVLFSSTVLATTSAKGQNRCVIQKLRVIDPVRTSIIPGEPLTILLGMEAVFPEGIKPLFPGIKVDLSSTRAPRMAAHQLSQIVSIDGEVFRNRLSSENATLNDAARFTPVVSQEDPTSQSKPIHPGEVYKFQCAASMFLKPTKKGAAFVLALPGSHEITFGNPKDASATVTVTVEQPISAETTLLRELEEHQEVLLFFAELWDCSKSSENVLRELESLLDRYSETRYQRFLSVAVGIGKACRLERRWQSEMEEFIRQNPRAPADRLEFERAYDRKLIDLGSYFHTPASGEVWSDFDIAALWYTAKIELNRAKYAPSREKSEEHIAGFLQLAEMIIRNPHSSGRWLQQASACDEMAKGVREMYPRATNP